MAVVAAVAETVATKASETEVVVRWRRKQRECLRGRYVGCSQWNQRGSGDGGKKSGGIGRGGSGRNIGNGFGGG